jgi:preprotein translocase subunit SecY
LPATRSPGLALLAGIAFFVLVVAGCDPRGARRSVSTPGASWVASTANTHIPLRVNTAGVIPIIFAQSFIMFPSTLALYFPNSGLALAASNRTGINGMWNHLASGSCLHVLLPRSFEANDLAETPDHLSQDSRSEDGRVHR